MSCGGQSFSTARPLGSEGMARRSKACGRRLSLRDQAKISSGRCAAVTWVLAFTLLLLCFLPSTVLADPPTFATASGNCSDGQITFPAQSSAHPDTLLHFQAVGSQGVVAGQGAGAVFGEGDTGWVPYGAVEAGTVPTAQIECSSGSVTAALADRPSAPATFSGVTTPGAVSFFGSSDSYLSFHAPGAGQYVLDATMSQGAITVAGVSGIIESSGEYSLGALGAGDIDLDIGAQSGPPAQWTLTVRELPVAINGLSFAQAFMAPGTGLPASFSVTGDTTITATVTNSAGQIVRSLGTFPVSKGSSSIPWDGRGVGGASLPDGVYTLSLASVDPSGDTTTAQTTITLDSTPPTAVMTSPQTIRPQQSVSFSVVDAESGVASISLLIDGQDVDAFGDYYDPLPTNGALSAPGPWSLGSHTWQIQTTDKVGNQATANGKFVASNAPPPAPKPEPAPKPQPKPTPMLPTGAGSVQYRPYVVTVSGDGSWYFGGSTGHQLVARRRSPSDLGRLHWTQYGATSARGTGVIWGLYGPGPLNGDTQFEREGNVKLHAYRPLNGVFTRLTYSGHETIRTSDGRILHYNLHGTSDAQESEGSWYW